jgi:DNA-binding transcriptional MerR regulator
VAKPPVHDPSEWFTATRAARLAGLSVAMVNYLCRTKLVMPSCDCRRGPGLPRHYSFGDVVALRLVARLSKAGISPLRLGKGLAQLREFHPEITLKSLPASHIVTDGQKIFLRQAGDRLEQVADGQYAFAFVVELDQVRSEVVRRMTPTQLKVAGGG